jgi:hypothetical protein
VSETAQAICSTATLSPSPSSATAGTSVTWTAAAGCDADAGDTAEYQFWMQPPGGNWTIVQPYAAGDTYTWDTTGLTDGTYNVGVWVRNQGSTAQNDASSIVPYTLGTSATCSNGGLAASPAGSANAGTMVTLTASASCGGTPEYQFWMQPPGSDWTVVQPYASSNTFTWDTTGLTGGTYNLGVWMMTQGSNAPYEAFSILPFILSNAASCSDGALAFSPASSASAGTTVTLTGSATCGGTPEYQFWLQASDGTWSVVQPYGTSATYDWNTTNLPSGDYTFGVWVLTQGSTAPYEAYGTGTYSVTSSGPCTDGTLAADPAGSTTVGTMVTVTGGATCGSPAEYQFWMLPPGGNWTIVQPYGASTTYGWDTSALATGTYQLGVWARLQGSSAAYDTYSGLSYTLQ